MVKIFISYSEKDRLLKESLEQHLTVLQRNKIVSTWSDREIVAGQDWGKEIDKNLINSDVILLLISSDFLSSDYCYDIEVKTAIKRHKNGLTIVVPVILRYCDWEGTQFDHLQVLPQDARPIKDWEDQDLAFLNVVEGLKEVIINMAKVEGKAMNKKITFRLENADLLEIECDLIALKHAQDFYGVDFLVADTLRRSKQVNSLDELRVKEGGTKLVQSKGKIVSPYLLFIGVVELYDFRYFEIKEFGSRVLESLSNKELKIRRIGTTIHGSNYGLDEKEALLSMIDGFIEGIDSGKIPSELTEIIIVEKNRRVFDRLKSFLRKSSSKFNLVIRSSNCFEYEARSKRLFLSEGASIPTKQALLQKEKSSILVLIPDTKEYYDIFHFGIQGAAHDLDMICEKVDDFSNLESRLSELDRKLNISKLVIFETSLISEELAFELGFIVGRGIPILLLSHEDEDVPKFLSNFNRIAYDSIFNLRKDVSIVLKKINK